MNISYFVLHIIRFMLIQVAYNQAMKIVKLADLDVKFKNHFFPNNSELFSYIVLITLIVAFLLIVPDLLSQLIP